MRKAFVLAGVVVGLVACGQALSSPGISTPRPAPFHPSASWGVYVLGGQSFEIPWQLMRLDAASLKDLQLAEHGQGLPVVSADGSTLVEIDYRGDGTALARVVDARTGAMRESFPLPFGSMPQLTPDGSKLIVIDRTGHSWRVFDTRDGRQTAKLETTTDPCCGLFGSWIDPSGHLLYRVLVPGSGMNATGPVTPLLVRYALQAGRETGRLKLDGVEAGVWPSGRTIGSEPVLASLTPGVAMSPDGSQLAVLYADGGRLMTVDTTSMKVIASRQLVAPPAPTGWFNLRPVDAYAKYDEGVQWDLTYSPDGRELVAAARQDTVDNNGNFSSHGLGLRAIDLQRAVIVADAPNILVGQLFYAPDGSALYVESFVDQSHMALLRLDPSTLAVAARREFTGPRQILLLAQP
jgi:DNA-binding beta-propeller fold protein YncE